MPTKPPIPCRHCGALLYDGVECPDHPRPKRMDTRPGATVRGYGWEWAVKVRDPFIVSHPWCVDPYGVHPEVQVKAQMVDHIVPRPAGTDDPSNLQSLCYRCHQLKGYRDGTRGRGMQKSNELDK